MPLIAAAGLPDRKLRKNIRLLAEQQGVSPEAFAPKSEKDKKPSDYPWVHINPAAVKAAMTSAFASGSRCIRETVSATSSLVSSK
tara:strand:+ start:1328 stop:1582 length:255 start_codon:yes stop_codon:yes gene_type:complete